MTRSDYDFETLPDLLRPGLVLVFVGINPSIYSVQRGHYFARSTSRFWPAFSRSKLSLRIRNTLGRETLDPGDDARLLDFGIGFTDVVKTPSSNASSIKPSDYALWAPRLLERLERCGAGMICFHGVTGYRAFCSLRAGFAQGADATRTAGARAWQRADLPGAQPEPGERALSRGRPGAFLR